LGRAFQRGRRQEVATLTVAPPPPGVRLLALRILMLLHKSQRT